MHQPTAVRFTLLQQRGAQQLKFPKHFSVGESIVHRKRSLLLDNVHEFATKTFDRPTNHPETSMLHDSPHSTDLYSNA